MKDIAYACEKELRQCGMFYFRNHKEVIGVTAVEKTGNITGYSAGKPAESSAVNAVTGNVAPEELKKTSKSTEKGSAGDAQASASDGAVIISESQGNSKTVNEEIRKRIEQINKEMIDHSEAIFGFHEDTNRVTIKIVDKLTKEVIKEYPPEKTLDMLAKVWEMAGIMVDTKK